METLQVSRPTAILMTSFGSTHLDTVEQCVARTERAVAERFPSCRVYRAFTSGMVIRRLREQKGISVDTVSQAMERIRNDGYTQVVVQPTLLLGGIEYERLLREVEKAEGLRVLVGRPLIVTERDCETMASVLMSDQPLDEGEALLLMGHGTCHKANEIYDTLQRIFAAKAYRGFIGTVESTPTFEDAVKQMKASGATRARLLPLMFVAGDHAKNDMAGDEEGSFLSVAGALGVEAVPIIRGLGECDAVHGLYADRVEEKLREMCGQ